MSNEKTEGSLIPEHVVQACHNGLSVTDALARQPHKSVKEVAEELFHSHGTHLHHKGHPGPVGSAQLNQTDLDVAASCGKFPYRPSDLILKVSLRCTAV